MSHNQSVLNWPKQFERTDPDERERTNKFDKNYRESKRDLKNEMRLLDVERWDLRDVTGSGGDPGVVVTWTKDGIDHAVACDHYKRKKSNLRELYKWINETRMRGNRNVETGQGNFTAAQLPSGEEDDAFAVAPSEDAPHEVLEVSPDASADTVEAVARRKLANYHPDTYDGDLSEPVRRRMYQKVKDAREAMLE